jgi:hypothetical protein
MMSGITVGPRQFDMQVMGVQGGNGAITGPWKVCPIDAAVGHGYYYQTKLDLRALTAEGEKSRGINLTAISLQESGPFDTTGGETEQGFIIYDVLTTTRPTEDQMFGWWNGLAASGYVPGFLPRAGGAGSLAVLGQTGFTASQVVWGYWRLFGMDRNIVLGSGAGVCKPQSSSQFGNGEVLVGPEVWYTRIVYSIANATQIVVPSANLTCWAEAVKMTEGQELTQMIRGSGR